MRRRRDHAELDQGRHEQRRHDDVGGRRRHAHAEHDAGHHGQEEREEQAVLSEAEHRLGEDDAERRSA